jgi:hypothetical protein
MVDYLAKERTMNAIERLTTEVQDRREATQAALALATRVLTENGLMSVVEAANLAELEMPSANTWPGDKDGFHAPEFDPEKPWTAQFILWVPAERKPELCKAIVRHELDWQKEIRVQRWHAPDEHALLIEEWHSYVGDHLRLVVAFWQSREVGETIDVAGSPCHIENHATVIPGLRLACSVRQAA